jgi:predicted lipid-binding transport protein (Tim44 family)
MGSANWAGCSYACGEMTADQTNVTPTCVNHPGVETRLTCSNCGNPICTRCMVTTAVGQKCPSCARQPRAAKGTPPPSQVARAFGAGLAAAVAGGFLLLLLPFRGGILLAAVYGYLVGAAVRWAARRRIHTQLGVAAAAAVVVGLGAVVALLGGAPLAPQWLLLYLVGGGVAFARAGVNW